MIATAKALGPADHVIGHQVRPEKVAPASTIATAMPSAVGVPLEVNTFACRHCGSVKLHARNGKFGYYFACIDCAKNTPIHSACPKCGKKERVRKDKLQFFGDCEPCNSSRAIYTNASLEAMNRT